MKITKSQLKQIIKEEATRFQKIQTLKEEAQRIRRQLKEMEEPLEDMSEGGEGDEYTFDEGFLGRAMGYHAPKSLMSAISNAKDADQLKSSVIAALSQVGGGKMKEVEWMKEFKDALNAKAKQLGVDGAWLNQNIVPAMKANIKGANLGSPSGGSGGVQGAFAG